MGCSPWGRRDSDTTEVTGLRTHAPAQFHRRGSFPAPNSRKRTCYKLALPEASAYQDKIVHLNTFNIINVSNLVGTDIYGKVLAFGRF